MDSVFTFIYNLFLVVAYTAAVCFMISFSLANRRRPWGAMSGLFSFFLIDTVIIYFTETMPVFADWYNDMFISIPAIKTVLYLGIAFFTIQTWNACLRQGFTPLQGAAVILLGLWYLFIPYLGHGALTAWLYYSAYQIFLFVMSACGLQRIKCREADYKQAYKELRWLLTAAMVFSLLILLEDTYVIFNVDSYEGASIYIQGRSFTEDILRMIYAVSAVRFFTTELVENGAEHPEDTIIKAGLNRKQDDNQEKIQTALLPSCAAATNNETDTAHGSHMLSYTSRFCLTAREQEVLFLLLANKSNQEICESLCISIGTVKAHIHHIFIKADVTHRSELLRNYYIFMQKASA